MSEFDFDGFFDNPDALEDDHDQGDDFNDGFQPFDPDQPNDKE